MPEQEPCPFPSCNSQDWCGRPCTRDPHKSNALLFHKNGTPKSLKERGLGYNDPPPTPATPKSRKPPPRLKAILTQKSESNKPTPKQESNTPESNAESNKPFDRKAYQRQYMKNRRAKKDQS